jgi:hypothetical protein
LLNDAARRERMGKAGLALMRQHEGATRRTLDLVREVLGDEKSLTGLTPHPNPNPLPQGERGLPYAAGEGNSPHPSPRPQGLPPAMGEGAVPQPPPSPAKGEGDLR